MRVLMVQALSTEEPFQEKVYPLGAAILANWLGQAGFEVDLLDLNVAREPYQALKEKLLGFRPEAVGLSLRNIDPLGNKTSSLIPPFAVTVRLISAVWPKARIIAGGTGFSLFPGRLMREFPQIRYGVVGEAEMTLPALLASLDNPTSLPGLCMRKGDRVVVNPPARHFDMRHYSPPVNLLADPVLYTAANRYVPPFGIETKRGCGIGCTYCAYPLLQGKRLRCRPVGQVVDQMELLNKQYGIERFHFTDPVLNTPRGHLETICEEILRRKLSVRWNGFFREDLVDENNIGLFEQAGCECFSFSPDGLSQEALDVLGKGLSVAHILKAAKLASRTGVLSVYHFMVNVPGETVKTAERGIRLLAEIFDLHAAGRNLGTVVLNNIRILPGTPMEAMARELGVIEKDTDLLYPVYFNPRPFDTLRYRLETLQLTRNVFLWQEVPRNEGNPFGTPAEYQSGTL